MGRQDSRSRGRGKSSHITDSSESNHSEEKRGSVRKVTIDFERHRESDYGKEELRQRKRRRQDSVSERTVPPPTQDHFENQRRGHRSSEMPPPKSLEPRRSDLSKDREREPIRLSPKTEVAQFGDVVSPDSSKHEPITFVSRPVSQTPGPPDPSQPPSTTGQLRVLLLIGFLGTQSGNPELSRQLSFPCPIHSVVITKYIREFFSAHRRVPISFLRCITNEVVAAQLRFLARDQDDHSVGLVSAPIKISTLNGGGVIVETFDFLRCDKLVRAALRTDHPYNVRDLWDRNRSLLRIGELVHDQIINDVDNFDIDNGLPKPQSKSIIDHIGKTVDISRFATSVFDHLSYVGSPTVGPSTTVTKLSKSTSAGMNIEELLSAPSAKVGHRP